MLLLWAVLFALQVRQRFGALQASVAGRIAPLESIQAKDRLDWVQLPGRLLGRCELPKGYTAGCKPLLLERVHNVRECLGVLGMTEGDTINYKGEVCQIQRCQEGQDELVLTTTYGPMEVYSVLCEALKDLPGLSTSRSKRIYVGKEEDYWTTSAEMKQDLRSFFMPLAANWTVLELGSYRGYTTRALAETFASVIAVDASEAFLNSNRRYNADRRNIFFVHLHSRVEGLRSLRQNEVQVAMVDAEHEYASVYRDTNQLLRYFRPSLKYLIFDDFGTDPGVMRAVREFVQSGRLRVLGGVGRKPPWTYRDQVIDSWEGVICEVMSNQSDVPMQRILGKWYTWFMSNLWESDDVIEFQKAGSCATSRGPGKWRLDHSQDRIMWLEWPSHKPLSMGGSNPERPVLEAWRLQFDEEWEKFAAIRADGRGTATGVDQEVMHSVVRRLFVSVNHEFCNSANECDPSLQR
ncbi:unnamed protein product [Durusdinium trenchii]|uniref:Uncharacterized protein n=1 Tax=Durusdinium trenchii TaxID=1381693 RepID=A0ABP0S5B8_9DINO